MNSGGIRQKGGRVSEKDGKIGMCVVVHAAGVGRCQRNTRDIVSGSVGNREYKIGDPSHGHEGATRPTRTSVCSSSPTQPRINSRQQYNHPSSSFSLSPTSVPSISYSSHSTSQKISLNFPLLIPSIVLGKFTERKCSLEVWLACEPRLARILRQ